MSRDMTSDFADAIAGPLIRPALLIEADFDSGSINTFTGFGHLTVGGKTYQGSAALLQIDMAEETAATEARGAIYTLSGVRQADIATYEEEDYQGRAIRTSLALFDASGILIGDPIRIFSGKMDVATIYLDTQKPTISLTAENDLIHLNRAKARYRTHEDQQIDYPRDMFFVFVPAMQNKEIVWK